MPHFLRPRSSTDALLTSRARSGLILLAFALAGGAAGAGWLLRDPLPRFLARRSTLAAVRVDSLATEGAYRLQPVHLRASSGLAVDLMLRRAIADSARRLPLVVILGGHHTGREAARLLEDTRGTMVAAVSYPFTGDPRPNAATFLRAGARHVAAQIAARVSAPSDPEARGPRPSPA